MKILLFFSLIVLLNPGIYSQSDYWVEQTSGVTVQLTSASVSTNFSQNAWICGYSGTVLRTNNNGTTWSNVSTGIPSATQLISISAIDLNNAVTAGYVGTN